MSFPKMQVRSWEESVERAGPETIVLLLHGMNLNARMLAPLRTRLLERLNAAELLVPELPLGTFDFVDLQELSEELAGVVDTRARAAGGQLKTIVLAGHSAGGVLAQSVCLDLQERLFLEGVRVRLVGIAPMTRGWEVSHHLSMLDKWLWSLGTELGGWLQDAADRTGWLLRKKVPRLWVFQIRRGSPFLVRLRLRWLECECAHLETVTLLGSVDEIVSWRDMVDEVVAKGEVDYRQVPYSNHAEIMNVEDPDYGEERARILTDAICPDVAVRGEGVLVTDDPPLPVDPEVTRMVFVIHGIRDEGHWTQKIAALARRYFEEEKPEGSAEKVAVETSSYGFFSMLEFLRPEARRKKIHWLMDEYVEARRRYPNARFSYVGHSHGTYLVAQALESYHEVKFERIAFAGSVVSSAYDWSGLLEEGRVSYVMNFAATADWVVSIFPRAAEVFAPLRRLVGHSLGGAGVVSFEAGERVWSQEYVVGGHGAAIQESNWGALAAFAVARGEVPPRPTRSGGLPEYRERLGWFYSRRWGPLFTLLSVLLLVLLVVGLGALAFWNPVWFWGIPLALVSGGGLLAAVIAGRADKRSFAVRRARYGRAGKILGLAAGLSLVWLLVPLVALLLALFVNGLSVFGFWSGGWEPAVVEFWNRGFGGFGGGMGGEGRGLMRWLGVVQGVSILFYAKGLHHILTKV
ncbi:MAG: alpha/beta hydrolase [Verrucomicrobiota bacterium]